MEGFGAKWNCILQSHDRNVFGSFSWKDMGLTQIEYYSHMKAIFFGAFLERLGPSRIAYYSHMMAIFLGVF